MIYGSYVNGSSTPNTLQAMSENFSASNDSQQLQLLAIKAPAGGGGSSVTNNYAYSSSGYANPHAVTSIGDGHSTTTYAYDNNGNMTSAGNGTATTSYSYDYANRLIALLYNGATSTTYGYDAFGQRVYQIIATSSTTTYPYKFYSVASTTKGTNNFATSTEYIFNGDTLLSTIDQPFKNGGATINAITRYIHPDHLGSTNVLTNASGTPVQTLDYYPYGGIRVSSSTSTANSARKYIGQFYDQNSGLDYLNARYYESSRGQFISQDPVFWEIGLTPDGKKALANPQFVNSYAYSSDNPITTKDPNGRAAISYSLLSGSTEGGFGGGAAVSFNVSLTFVTGPDGGLALTGSYGGFGGGGQKTVGYPSTASISGSPNNGPFVLGSWAGGGCAVPQCGAAFQVAGAFSPTINNIADLSGPANSVNASLEFGSFSQQTDRTGNKTYAFGVKGLAKGASVSTYPVQNWSFTLVNTRSMINTATTAYGAMQATIAQIQSKIAAIREQIGKLTQSLSTGKSQ